MHFQTAFYMDSPWLSGPAQIPPVPHCSCPLGKSISSRTNLQVLVLGPQVLVLGPQVLVLGLQSPQKLSRTLHSANSPLHIT